jgi:uncharacterized protein YjdB
MRRGGIMALVALVAVSCSDGGSEPVAVASVEVSAPSPSVAVYRTLQLAATVKNRKGKTLAGRGLNWSSSSETVATVSTSGLVTGVAAGTVVVTATSEGKSGTLTLEISPAPVDTVTLTPDSATLAQGTTGALTVTLKDERGVTLTGRTVVWTSDSVNVATVADGVVTALNSGTARIAATVEGMSDTATITVRDSVASVTLGPATSIILYQGQTTTFTIIVRSGSGAWLLGRPVEWTTSDDAVATVSAEGLVRALAAGTATIGATVEGEDRRRDRDGARQHRDRDRRAEDRHAGAG